MPEENVDTALQIAREAIAEGIDTNDDLLYGYDEANQSWQVIIKYNGDIKKIETLFADTKVVELFNQYAVVTTKAQYLSAIAALPEVEYMEKPKKLYYNLDFSRSISCINAVQETASASPGQAVRLSGQGVLVGIVDSGIDYFHPAFRKADGSTRIAYLWDQSMQRDDSRVPIDYGYGQQYSMEDINAALEVGNRTEGQQIVPATDRGSGHGTSVAGVAAGNGAGSAGLQYRGVAIDSELIVVKLGRSDTDFAGTTEVMEGMDYILRKSLSLQRPVAINLSFGTNMGAHAGNSLFEDYITSLNGVWKNVIVAASGNEGDARHHASVNLVDLPVEIPFVIGQNERSLSLQIWKEYADDFLIEIETPSMTRVPVLAQNLIGTTYDTGTTRIFFYYGNPTPYSARQEIYMEWIPAMEGGFIESGIWKIYLTPQNIRDGQVELWLPTVEAIGLSTGFLFPEPNTTLTSPSSARKIIAVGAYRAENDSVASFSGRGNTADGRQGAANGLVYGGNMPGGEYGMTPGYEFTGTSTGGLKGVESYQDFSNPTAYEMKDGTLCWKLDTPVSEGDGFGFAISFKVDEGYWWEDYRIEDALTLEVCDTDKNSLSKVSGDVVVDSTSKSYSFTMPGTSSSVYIGDTPAAFETRLTGNRPMCYDDIQFDITYPASGVTLDTSGLKTSKESFTVGDPVKNTEEGTITQHVTTPAGYKGSSYLKLGTIGFKFDYKICTVGTKVPVVVSHFSYTPQRGDKVTKNSKFTYTYTVKEKLAAVENVSIDKYSNNSLTTRVYNWNIGEEADSLSDSSMLLGVATLKNTGGAASGAKIYHACFNTTSEAVNVTFATVPIEINASSKKVNVKWWGIDKNGKRQSGETLVEKNTGYNVGVLTIHNADLKDKNIVSLSEIEVGIVFIQSIL